MRARHATPEDVAAAIEGWGADVKECRAYGHQWVPSTATYSRDNRSIYTTQTCGRLSADGESHATRHAELNARTGAVLNSHITYAEGYLVKGLGRVTGDAKGAIRLAVVAQSYGLVMGIRRGRKRGA